jgi:hypothetical protein
MEKTAGFAAWRWNIWKVIFQTIWLHRFVLFPAEWGDGDRLRREFAPQSGTCLPLDYSRPLLSS